MTIEEQKPVSDDDIRGMLSDTDLSDIGGIELDPVMGRELTAISDMLLNAKRYGLEVEVLYSFYNAAKSGDSVEDAANYALYEWDI